MTSVWAWEWATQAKTAERKFAGTLLGRQVLTFKRGPWMDSLSSPGRCGVRLTTGISPPGRVWESLRTNPWLQLRRKAPSSELPGTRADSIPYCLSRTSGVQERRLANWQDGQLLLFSGQRQFFYTENLEFPWDSQLIHSGFPWPGGAPPPTQRSRVDDEARMARAWAVPGSKAVTSGH